MKIAGFFWLLVVYFVAVIKVESAANGRKAPHVSDKEISTSEAGMISDAMKPSGDVGSLKTHDESGDDKADDDEADDDEADDDEAEDDKADEDEADEDEADDDKANDDKSNDDGEAKN